MLLSLLQGSTSTSTSTSAAVRLNAAVTGLGPAFKLTLELCNSDSQPMLGAALVRSFASLRKHLYSADERIALVHFIPHLCMFSYNLYM